MSAPRRAPRRRRDRGTPVDREHWALYGLRDLAARVRADGREYLTAAEDRRADVLSAMLDGARRAKAEPPPPERARALVAAAAAALNAERETTRLYLQALAREGWALGQLRKLTARVRAEGREYLTPAEDAQVSSLAYMLDGARQVQAALLASLAEQLEDSGAHDHDHDRRPAPRG